MAHIIAPAKANLAGEFETYYGPTRVLFVDGEADVDDLPDSTRNYLLANGYTVDGDSYNAGAPEVERVDARDAAAPQTVGTATQDAAVNPDAADFLAPVNAGDADPHGPQVVAPGIHAEGERVVRSGPVASDPATQDAAESRFAEKLLVEQEQITPPVDPSDFLEQGGPLGLSDPGSADAGVAAAKADQSFADAGAALSEPKGNASRGDWAAYARSQGATDADLLDADGQPKSRDDLRAAYGS